MPTIVDSLIVTLGLDDSKFTAGQKMAIGFLRKTESESKETAKRMEANGKQAAEFFTTVKQSALSLATVLLGGMGVKKFTEYVVTSDRAVGRLSANLELSIEQLSAWQGVAQRFGSSSEDIDNAFRSTMKLVQAIQHGEVPAETLQWLARSGVDLSKFLAAATPMEEKLKMVQQAFAKTTAAEAQFFGGMTGYSEATVNMLRGTASNIELLLAQQRELGVATDDSRKSADMLAKSWHDMEDAGMGAGRRLLSYWAPLLAILLQTARFFFRDISGQNPDNTTPGAPKAVTGKIRRGGEPVPSGGTDSGLMGLMQKLEGSGPNSVSPKGAIGRNQIMPGTARQYGFDPGRLFEPEYNDQVARAILADLSKKYNGNTDQILAAYNAGEGGSSKFRKTGDTNTLPKETQKYLAHAHQIQATNGASGGRGGISTVSIGQVAIYTQATDAQGIAREIGPALQTYGHVLPSNPGLN